MISNKELFDELYNSIKAGMSIDNICKNFGGGYCYIPSFKRTYRNDEIKMEYFERIKQDEPKSIIIRELATKYDLSIVSIYNIIKDDTTA
jgi:Mor family transcriptional regulator